MQQEDKDHQWYVQINPVQKRKKVLQLYIYFNSERDRKAAFTSPTCVSLIECVSTSARRQTLFSLPSPGTPPTRIPRSPHSERVHGLVIIDAVSFRQTSIMSLASGRHRHCTQFQRPFELSGAHGPYHAHGHHERDQNPIPGFL